MNSQFLFLLSATSQLLRFLISDTGRIANTGKSRREPMTLISSNHSSGEWVLLNDFYRAGPGWQLDLLFVLLTPAH